MDNNKTINKISRYIQCTKFVKDHHSKEKIDAGLA